MSPPALVQLDVDRIVEADELFQVGGRMHALVGADRNRRPSDAAQALVLSRGRRLLDEGDTQFGCDREMMCDVG